MVEVYGIKNCNTVKKALVWLDEHQIPYHFNDFKKTGVSDTQLEAWDKVFGWEKLVNKKGTTWRKLTPEQQAAVIDKNSAFTVLKDNTSMIKRPIVESDKGLLIGFDEAEYDKVLG